MKIFISGLNDCEKYKDAIKVVKGKLCEMGFDVCMQSNDALVHYTSLLESDIVYFIDGWFESSKCRTDFNICAELNKGILFQKPLPFYDDYRKTIKLQHVLHEVTGVSFDDIISPSRKQDIFFARTLFVWYCFTKLKLRLTKIARIIKRDNSTMNHYLKTFDNFMNDPQSDIAWFQQIVLNKMNPSLPGCPQN